MKMHFMRYSTFNKIEKGILVYEVAPVASLFMYEGIRVTCNTLLSRVQIVYNK